MQGHADGDGRIDGCYDDVADLEFLVAATLVAAQQEREPVLLASLPVCDPDIYLIVVIGSVRILAPAARVNGQGLAVFIHAYKIGQRFYKLALHFYMHQSQPRILELDDRPGLILTKFQHCQLAIGAGGDHVVLVVVVVGLQLPIDEDIGVLVLGDCRLQDGQVQG